MRWLFLIVLSLNLAYIAWQMSLPAPDSYAQVPPLKNVPAIVLLSEVQTGEKPDTASPALSIAQQEAGANSTAEPASTVEPSAATAELVTENTGLAVPEDAPGKSLAAKVPAELKPEESSESGGCYTLGPFRDLEVLRSLTREIKSYVVATDFRGLEEKAEPLYWVYIKPQIDMSKAIETGERLKANKVKDFYIIREGENINAISLGYFRNKTGAYRLAKRVSKLGFDVLVEPEYKTYTVYWLDYQLGDGATIPEDVLDKYIKSVKEGEVSLLGRDCGA